MAFEDYHSIPKAELQRTKELYDNQQNGDSKKEQYEPKPEKFKPLKEKAVKTKKVGLGDKFRDVFYINDPAYAREKVFDQVFVPQIKDLFMNLIWGYFTSFLYDTPMAAPRRKSRADIYNQASDRGLGTMTREKSGPKRADGVKDVGQRRMADDLIFDSMAEAQEYLDVFVDYITRYEILSIGDVYDTCGLSHSYTDDRWGWKKTLAGANVRRLSGNKYTIYFPKAEPL